MAEKVMRTPVKEVASLMKAELKEVQKPFFNAIHLLNWIEETKYSGQCATRFNLTSLRESSEVTYVSLPHKFIEKSDTPDKGVTVKDSYVAVPTETIAEQLRNQKSDAKIVKLEGDSPSRLIGEHINSPYEMYHSWPFSAMSAEPGRDYEPEELRFNNGNGIKLQLATPSGVYDLINIYGQDPNTFSYALTTLGYGKLVGLLTSLEATIESKSKNLDQISDKLMKRDHIAAPPSEKFSKPTEEELLSTQSWDFVLPKYGEYIPVVSITSEGSDWGMWLKLYKATGDKAIDENSFQLWGRGATGKSPAVASIRLDRIDSLDNEGLMVENLELIRSAGKLVLSKVEEIAEETLHRALVCAMIGVELSENAQIKHVVLRGDYSKYPSADYVDVGAPVSVQRKQIGLQSLPEEMHLKVDQFLDQLGQMPYLRRTGSIHEEGVLIFHDPDILKARERMKNAIAEAAKNDCGERWSERDRDDFMRHDDLPGLGRAQSGAWHAALDALVDVRDFWTKQRAWLFNWNDENPTLRDVIIETAYKAVQKTVPGVSDDVARDIAKAAEDVGIYMLVPDLEVPNYAEHKALVYKTWRLVEAGKVPYRDYNGKLYAYGIGGPSEDTVVSTSLPTSRDTTASKSSPTLVYEETTSEKGDFFTKIRRTLRLGS